MTAHPKQHCPRDTPEHPCDRCTMDYCCVTCTPDHCYDDPDASDADFCMACHQAGLCLAADDDADAFTERDLPYGKLVEYWAGEDLG